MAELARCRVELSWDSGGPGVNTFYWSKGSMIGDSWYDVMDVALEELQVTYEGLAPIIADTAHWAISPDFDIIDVESGNIIDQDSLTREMGGGTGSATATGVSRAQQAYFRFKTDNFTDGYRLAGGTFIGPIASGMDENGKFGSAARLEYEDAWTAPTSGLGPRLAVYHRPVTTGVPSDGYYGDVVQVRMKDVPGTLRSRRD
jgi:hypothetical protein